MRSSTNGTAKSKCLPKARDEIAYIAYFIESEGLPETAKKFVDDCILFFAGLSNPVIKHRLCLHLEWRAKGYRCANFRKKFVVAYIDAEDEITICDFALQKRLV
jgi:hypothetical protein